MSKRFLYDTEDKIFLEAERMMDRLDKEYLKSDMTEEEYKLRCEEISYWEDLRLIEIRSKKVA